MTDQRTLKKIIAEQRGTIEKQKLIIDELNKNYLKLNAAFETSDELLGKTNDELMQYKEENYDMLYEIAFLREDLTDAAKVFTAALDRAKLTPQPQDMKTRLTFTFDEFQTLQKALSLCENQTKKEVIK